MVSSPFGAATLPRTTAGVKWSLAATYVDKILKGAKAADLWGVGIAA